MKTLWLVVPCYNEEEVLPETCKRLRELMIYLEKKGKISSSSKIAFVNDGSNDATWSMIEQLYQYDKMFVGINLARNRGHQYALLAGLMTARKYSDAAVSLDADLQDDISVIEEMVDDFDGGCDIVYGVRSSRETDTFFKKFTAEGFYKLLSAMGVEIVFNHADYRLMSKRALDALAEFDEVNLFLRGIVPQIGFKTAKVTYSRAKRFAGESKYPLKKMLALAFDGITSFSVRPLRVASVLGCFAFLVAIVILIYSLIEKCAGNTVAGWTFLNISIWALGGLQLLMIGIIGEYVGKIYLETKHRPKYIIESVLLNDGGRHS